VTDDDNVIEGPFRRHLDGETAATRKWADRLDEFVTSQGVATESLRTNRQPEPPWPEQDNPMLAYITEGGSEIADAEGTTSALIWLAVHAWFEGALAAHARSQSGSGDPAG